MGLKLPIKKSDRNFKSYPLYPLGVKGMITLPVTHNDKTVKVKFYVINLDHKILLSSDVSEKLGFIQRIYTITGKR